MIVPIAIAVADAAGVSPVQPALGATLGASMAFMLPVSTPPNAIVYSSGRVPLTAMIRHGFVIDLVGYVVVVTLVMLLGDVVVASIHWGSNWGYEVPRAHARFAHRLIDGGVDIVHGHSSHHPRPIEVYRGKLALYGCGDFIDDYEGISGHEEYRDDLVLMYFPTVDAHTGRLVELVLVPMRIQKMRLNRAPPAEAEWLRDRVTAISRAFGSRVDMTADGRLLLASRQRPERRRPLTS